MPLLARACLALACFSAFADDQWVIRAKGGDIYTILPSSMRADKDISGGSRITALVDQVRSGEPSRVRFAITGCGTGSGHAAVVDPNGKPVGGLAEWVDGGTKVIDAIAATVCMAGRTR